MGAFSGFFSYCGFEFRIKKITATIRTASTICTEGECFGSQGVFFKFLAIFLKMELLSDSQMFEVIYLFCL